VCPHPGLANECRAIGGYGRNLRPGKFNTTSPPSFDDDFIDAYVDLKMSEVIRFEHTPHPVEFEMYYSA